MKITCLMSALLLAGAAQADELTISPNPLSDAQMSEIRGTDADEGLTEAMEELNEAPGTDTPKKFNADERAEHRAFHNDEHAERRAFNAEERAERRAFLATSPTREQRQAFRHEARLERVQFNHQERLEHQQFHIDEHAERVAFRQSH